MSLYPTLKTHHDVRNESRGFSLIELLTVVAIIGILASVTLASLSGARERGRDSKRITALAEIGLALEFYYNACGRQYPSPSPLVVERSNGCPTGTTLGSFISTIPVDPLGSTNAYEYGVSGSSYTLKAKLERNDAALIDDLDGTQNGLTCNDGPTGTPSRYFYCKGS